MPRFVGGKEIAELARDWERCAESRIATFRCAFCDWERVAKLEVGRAAHVKHRLKAHGLGPPLKREIKCHKHDCPRRTRSASGLCPEHQLEALKNLSGRRPGGRRPTLGMFSSSLNRVRS